MAKSEEKLVSFCSKLTPSNKKAIRKYAADKDVRLYVALNEIIKKGLQN